MKIRPETLRYREFSPRFFVAVLLAGTAVHKAGFYTRIMKPFFPCPPHTSPRQSVFFFFFCAGETNKHNYGCWAPPTFTLRHSAESPRAAATACTPVCRPDQPRRLWRELFRPCGEATPQLFLNRPENKARRRPAESCSSGGRARMQLRANVWPLAPVCLSLSLYHTHAHIKPSTFVLTLKQL